MMSDESSSSDVSQVDQNYTPDELVNDGASAEDKNTHDASGEGASEDASYPSEPDAAPAPEDAPAADGAVPVKEEEGGVSPKEEEAPANDNTPVDGDAPQNDEDALATEDTATTPPTEDAEANTSATEDTSTATPPPTQAPTKQQRPTTFLEALFQRLQKPYQDTVTQVNTDTSDHQQMHDAIKTLMTKPQDDPERVEFELYRVLLRKMGVGHQANELLQQDLPYERQPLDFDTLKAEMTRDGNEMPDRLAFYDLDTTTSSDDNTTLSAEVFLEPSADDARHSATLFDHDDPESTDNPLDAGKVTVYRTNLMQLLDKTAGDGMLVEAVNRLRFLAGAPVEETDKTLYAKLKNTSLFSSNVFPTSKRVYVVHKGGVLYVYILQAYDTGRYLARMMDSFGDATPSHAQITRINELYSEFINTCITNEIIIEHPSKEDFKVHFAPDDANVVTRLSFVNPTKIRAHDDTSSPKHRMLKSFLESMEASTLLVNRVELPLVAYKMMQAKTLNELRMEEEVVDVESDVEEAEDDDTNSKTAPDAPEPSEAEAEAEETERKRAEEEAKAEEERKREEERKQEEEAERKREEERKQEEEAERKREEERKQEEEAERKREEEEAERKREEEEAKAEEERKREEDVRKREEDVRKREEQQQQTPPPPSAASHGSPEDNDATDNATLLDDEDDEMDDDIAIDDDVDDDLADIDEHDIEADEKTETVAAVNPATSVDDTDDVQQHTSREHAATKHTQRRAHAKPVHHSQHKQKKTQKQHRKRAASPHHPHKPAAKKPKAQRSPNEKKLINNRILKLQSQLKALAKKIELDTNK